MADRLNTVVGKVWGALVFHGKATSPAKGPQGGGQEALESMMIASLSRAIDFVKFAETKNAALLTLASAWILASATLAIQSVARETPQILWGLIFGAPCFLAAAILATVSFLPQIKLTALLGEADDQANLLFFGDLARTCPKAIYNTLRKRYATDGADTLNAAYFTDLGCQIGVNSRIARRKYHLFLWGVTMLLLGFAIYVFNAGALVVDRLMAG